MTCFYALFTAVCFAQTLANRIALRRFYQYKKYIVFFNYFCLCAPVTTCCTQRARRFVWRMYLFDKSVCLLFYVFLQTWVWLFQWQQTWRMAKFELQCIKFVLCIWCGKQDALIHVCIVSILCLLTLVCSHTTVGMFTCILSSI